jgi:hypothetical protein
MPTDRPQSKRDDLITRPLTFVIYAPFGSDVALSNYPENNTQRVNDHPLLAAGRAVAALGVNVTMLVDRVNDDSHLITIPANGEMRVESQFKCDMSSPRCLRELLHRADRQFPLSTIVLALEGHGAGYFPEIDRSKLSVASLTNLNGTPIEWVISPEQLVPRRSDDGLPVLPMGEPMLPMGEPMLPASHYPMSTWGVGAALRDYVEQRADRCSNIAVIHFNNCFNMSIELLHTIAPYAQHAVSYPNYNFFSSGRAYPRVFERFLADTNRDSATLARLMSKENQIALAAQAEPHPTVGCALDLSNIKTISIALDALSNALIDALPTFANQIAAVIAKAQQYDTRGDFTLDVPDALTDLGSLAYALSAADIGAQVTQTANALASALKGTFVYGETAKPWVADNIEWKLNDPRLAMNIYLPDPSRQGLWDWRSAYYFATAPGESVAQPYVIDFLQHTRWVPFLRKFHQATPFRGLRPPVVLDFPIAGHYKKGSTK